MNQNNEATGKWLVRVQHKQREIQGAPAPQVLVELVWSLTGKVHHSLTGATGQKAMEDYARALNQRGYIPPEKVINTRADGFKQSGPI